MSAPPPDDATSAPFAAGGRWTRRRVLTLVAIVVTLFAIAYGLGRVLGSIEHQHDHDQDHKAMGRQSAQLWRGDGLS